MRYQQAPCNTIQLGDRLLGETLSLWRYASSRWCDFTSPQNPDSSEACHCHDRSNSWSTWRRCVCWWPAYGRALHRTQITYSLSDRDGAVIQNYPYALFPAGHICYGDNRTNSLGSKYFQEQLQFLLWPLRQQCLFSGPLTVLAGYNCPSDIWEKRTSWA